ncbi:MAG: NAD(P)/FAD-dependent oxidoreductase [Vicinamibacterales bacterium]
MYDVIVCGAGPAGSVAATVLARGGARVLLIDRARFPRAKLCGDTMNPGTVAILRRLAMTGDVEASARPVDGMIVTGEHGVRVSAPYAAGVQGLAIERRVLDEALMRAAVAAGVRVEEGVLVRGPLLDATGREPRVRGIVMAGRDGRDVRVPAPMIIAADGRRSRLAVGVGLARQPRHPRRWAIGAYFQHVAGMTSFGEMHVRRGRYIGVAPLPSGETNVCLVIPGPASVRGAGPGFDDPSALLRLALDGDRPLRERFADARMTAAPVMLGPLAVDAAQCGMPGLLLAGDAAGFIDPMTGDGLRFAVRGGELAADVALALFGGLPEQPHVRLARLRRRDFAAKWRFNRALRRLVSATATVELAGVAAAAAPWILRRAIAFAGDVPQR